MIHRRRATGGLLVLSLLLIGLLLQVGCHGNGETIARATADFPPGTGFLTHDDVIVDGTSHQVCVFIPKSYDPGRRYPAILFLHGLF